jgi:OmpA-OmpF porin, OOP family
MTYINLPTLFVALLVLAGCSDWWSGPSMKGNAMLASMNVASADETAPKKPSTFTEGLGAEYASFATTLSQTPSPNTTGDWADADFFARKSLAASSGVAVPPEENANWLVPLEVPYQLRTKLSDGRERLVSALDSGRNREPLVAAKAQARYDCWVERMQADWRSDMAGRCRDEFYAALDELAGQKAGTTTPPRAEHKYNIYFGFDESHVTPEGSQTIDTIAAAVRADPALKILLVGKADRAGTPPYNMTLSERRADTVRKALIGAGVPADRIVARWTGENDPVVPTPDGVRDGRNRVVQVTIE